MKLPDISGLVVAFDTEGSGLFTDDGARVSAASCAWRDPSDNSIKSFATPFDQGLYDLPLGPKTLINSHTKRVTKWEPADLIASNKPPAAWDHLMRWLLRQRLVMQNAKYDMLMVLAGLRNGNRVAGQAADYPVLTGFDLAPALLWDTMLASGVLWPGETTSLKPTSVRLHVGAELGIEDGAEADEAEALGPWKGPKTDLRYDLIPWRVLGPYSCLDAELTLLLYERQQRDLVDRTHHQRHIAEELALTRTLYGMERRGVGFDRSGCIDESVKLGRKIIDASKLVPFRGGTGMPTPPAAQKWFFGAPADGGLGLLPYNDKRTKGGSPQVDEEVIERLVKRGAKGAKEYAGYAELKAANEKWYLAWPPLTGADGRLRTCHRQGRVVSGRLSVERWQAQAMPHDYIIPAGIIPIRYFLTAADGCEDWESDASQAEIRVATIVAECTPMLRALKLGIDSHDAATKLMFYPETKLATAKTASDWDQMRQVAKRCNLGILYGIGAGGLRTQIAKFTGRQVTVDQCRDWIDDWKTAFPQFADALYEYADLATRQGYVRLITGRVRKFSEFEPVHKAFNQCIQGNVAEAMKLAMIRFDREFPGMLLLQIHDSLVAEIPAARVGEVTEAMQRIMIETFEQLFRPVPFKTDCKPFGRGAYV